MSSQTFSRRNKRVVKMIDLEGRIGLELGPLTTPIIRKDQADIYYLDHMSQADLKEKYKNEPVDPGKIVPIDYVLRNNSVKQSVGSKKFDYVIASHVIEHIPDVVSWLEDINSVLNDGGILSLVVPDKRFTFDLFREDTTPADTIGAYVDRLGKPSSSTMYSYATDYAKDIDTASVWNDREYYSKVAPERRWTREEALQMCRNNTFPETYIDTHCSVYTPESFLDITRELTRLKLINFEICNFIDTQEYELEFFVTLRKIKVNDENKDRIIKKIPKIKNYNIDTVRQIELEGKNELLSREVELLKNSLSWRVTEPLRKVKKILKG